MNSAWNCKVALVLLSLATACLGTPVSLASWYPHNFDGGNTSSDWVINGDAVEQRTNGNPTAFLSGQSALGRAFQGDFVVSTATSDDDMIGFVLGYDTSAQTPVNAAGDSRTPGGEFLVIDWKRGNQAFCGGTANAGLRVLHVKTLTSAFRCETFWGGNTTSDAEVIELARASTGVSTGGYVRGTTYQIMFDYTPTRLLVWVNGVLVVDVTGNFPDGEFGFYNYSQNEVTYSGFVEFSATGNPDNAGPSTAQNDCSTCTGSEQCHSNTGSFSAEASSTGTHAKLCFSGNTCQ